MRTLAAIAAFAAIVSAVNVAQADPANNEAKLDLIDRLLTLDGTESQLESMHQQMLLGIEPYQKKMTPEDYDLLLKSVEENFKGKTLLANYRKVMVGQITEDDLKGALTWFESPLAKRVAQLQIDSGSKESLAAIRKLSEGLDKSPTPPARDKLLKDLQAALKATDLLLDLTVNIARGVAVGQMAVHGDTTEADIAAVRRHLDQIREQSRKRIEHDAYVNNLYTYRTLTDDELRDCIAFYKTKVGHSVVEASFFALNDSLQDAAEEVGREIGRLRRALGRH